MIKYSAEEESIDDLLWEQTEKELDRKKRVECFVAKLLQTIPFNQLVNLAVEAKVTNFRMCRPAEDPAVADILYWLWEYEVPTELPKDYVFAQRLPDGDEDE